jgi:hypothetical protein
MAHAATVIGTSGYRSANQAISAPTTPTTRINHRDRLLGKSNAARLMLPPNAANQRRADARTLEHIYGWCALAAFAC